MNIQLTYPFMVLNKSLITMLSQHIYFLDVTKAFNKVNHWILFRKLLERKIPNIMVFILLVWYNEQHVFVHWNKHISQPFIITNGVCQGGILSPYFINVYVDELGIMLNDTE